VGPERQRHERHTHANRKVCVHPDTVAARISVSRGTGAGLRHRAAEGQTDPDIE
jgi:hypothetical protein